MIKILIIDDERDIRNVLKKRLQKNYNCWIDVASNVESGLEFCKRKKYDLIFFDYLFLDNTDGFNLLYSIKRKAEQCVTVMISGYMKNAKEVEAKGYGVTPDEFIPKPFPDKAIEKVMDTYFPDQKLKKIL